MHLSYKKLQKETLCDIQLSFLIFMLHFRGCPDNKMVSGQFPPRKISPLPVRVKVWFRVSVKIRVGSNFPRTILKNCTTILLQFKNVSAIRIVSRIVKVNMTLKADVHSANMNLVISDNAVSVVAQDNMVLLHSQDWKKVQLAWTFLQSLANQMMT